MKMTIPKPLRCAIYTRKSTEHNLDLAFNSLDAQREACEAYIKSQAHEGWRLLPEHYDDGGLSGASLERPALQFFLTQVREGRVDVIVVYKVDRLTRSLADFAKLVEEFDAHEVSFVSVTQSFNTTSSMGRLTLNVLLSFAQFEREVIGERVRDKIAASKRTLVTCVGKLELRVPQDRDGRFSTELFERYQRSEQALVATLAEMYVQGVSTRKVKAITEELCGDAFSASSISAINKRLDESLEAFAERPLEEPFPYLILDARYEKVREGGIVASQAVLIAIGIDWDGRRQILAVEMANRESRSSWRDFLLGLRKRGLRGVELVVADDHAGLRAAIREVLSEAAFQRCYVHFLRNALDHLPRKADDDCLQELRWLYDRRSVEEARRDLAAWIAKWGARYQKLVAWAEETIDETLTFYRLPRQHHKHLKSTNMLERLNEEIRRRTYVVRIFPNSDACRRLIRALAVETHENWLEAHRYLNMNDLKEHKKIHFPKAA